MLTFLRLIRPTLLISALLILTFLVYAQVLRHEFVNWDDNTHITGNLQVRSLAFDNIARIFTATVHKTYIPLTMLSFAVEYHFVGDQPLLYHLNNVLLHLLVVFLAFRIGIALGLKEGGALVAAFIFALHPIHVESVAWATERKDVLYAAFYLAAVLFYLRYARTRKVIDYSASLLTGFLSMLAKAMAVSLPLILILCDWMNKQSLKKVGWLNKLTYFFYIVPVAWITVSLNVNMLGQKSDPNQFFPFWAGVFYLKKFFWPDVFVPHYVPELPESFWQFEYWSTVAIIAAVVLVFWFWSNRWYRFSVLWYFLSIFFLLNFDYKVPLQPVADRFMYLPSLGFCFFAGHIMEKIWQNKRASSWPVRSVIITALVGLALFLSVKTYVQIGVWKESFVLWNYIIEHSPKSYLALNNRGRIYERRGQLDLAMKDYQDTVKANPKFSKAYKNIGRIYELKGDIASAIEAYSIAIKVNPSFSGAYNNRALLYTRQDKTNLALADYTAAIKADPKYFLAYSNRGALYVRLGQKEKGLKDLSHAIKLQPFAAEVYNYRAAVYLELNMPGEALKDCQASLRLNSRQAAATWICTQANTQLNNSGKGIQLSPGNAASKVYLNRPANPAPLPLEIPKGEEE